MKMKRMYKQFLALVLAVTMVMSYGIAVSAAEINEDFESNEDMKVVFVNEDGSVLDVVDADESGIIEYDVDDTNITSNIERSARSIDILNQTYSNQGIDDKRTITRTMSQSGYLVVRLYVKGSAHIKVNIKNGLLWYTLYEDTATNALSSKRSVESIPQGRTVEITITPKVNNTTYTIQAWIE